MGLFRKNRVTDRRKVLGKKEAGETKPVHRLAWEEVVQTFECGGSETWEQLPCTGAIHVGDLGEKL